MPPTVPGRRPAGRMVVFSSGLTGAGASTTALNVAARLTHHGDVLLLDCDLSGRGVTAIATSAPDLPSAFGLGDALQDGVHLAPGALLERPAQLEVATDDGAGSGELLLVAGRGRSASALSGWIVHQHEASRRLDELLALLFDWSEAGAGERWVVVDVPPHPFVAPLVVDAIGRATDRVEPSHGSAPMAAPLLLMCFAWTVEHLAHVSRLTRPDAAGPSFEALCTRGRLDAGVGRRCEDGASPLAARSAAPAIPFDPILLGGARMVRSGGEPEAPSARAYDSLVDWIRRAP